MCCFSLVPHSGFFLTKSVCFCVMLLRNSWTLKNQPAVSLQCHGLCGQTAVSAQAVIVKVSSLIKSNSEVLVPCFVYKCLSFLYVVEMRQVIVLLIMTSVFSNE